MVIMILLIFLLYFATSKHIHTYPDIRVYVFYTFQIFFFISQIPFIFTVYCMHKGFPISSAFFTSSILVSFPLLCFSADLIMFCVL
jgi:hypothetical protein